MRYLLDGLQMKNRDARTIQNIGIPSMVLMERAALRTLEIMERRAVDLTRVLIVCGSGNNGGDGFVIARLLLEKGYEPVVVFVGRETSMTEQSACQLAILRRMGVSVSQTISPCSYTAVVDAVFGVGLSRNIEGRYAQLLEQMNQLQGIKIAVDIPSGVHADTGQIMGTAFRADITVTYAYEKLGTVLFPGTSYAGRVYTVNIGIPQSGFPIPEEKESDLCFTYDKCDLKALLPVRTADSHKGTYGRLLMIVGSFGMAGAAYLSARAAYETGVGLVRIYTSRDNREVLQQMLPEAVITTYEKFEPDTLKELMEWAEVTVIGCGLGKSAVSEALLLEAVKLAETPLVIDADGLNILSEHMEVLERSAESDLTDVPIVLTPHMKEMSRLTGGSVAQLQADRFTVLADFTERYPVTCVLKDARTLVQKKEQCVYVNTSGNSAMSKAGSGDVLAGVIGGLMAQHLPDFQAACTGVFLHGCAGDDAREKNGAYSVLARDLINGIRSCLKEAAEERKENETI